MVRIFILIVLLRTIGFSFSRVLLAQVQAVAISVVDGLLVAVIAISPPVGIAVAITAAIAPAVAISLVVAVIIAAGLIVASNGSIALQFVPFVLGFAAIIAVAIDGFVHFALVVLNGIRAGIPVLGMSRSAHAEHRDCPCCQA